jgi:hypothetical protein
MSEPATAVPAGTRLCLMEIYHGHVQVRHHVALIAVVPDEVPAALGLILTGQVAIVRPEDVKTVREMAMRDVGLE